MILSELLDISKFTDGIASNDLTKSECASVDEMTFFFCVICERMPLAPTERSANLSIPNFDRLASVSKLNVESLTTHLIPRAADEKLPICAVHDERCDGGGMPTQECHRLSGLPGSSRRLEWHGYSGVARTSRSTFLRTVVFSAIHAYLFTMYRSNATPVS